MIAGMPAATPVPTMAPPGTIPTPVDNYFQNPGVNPFIDTREDHLSTFAIDVDTASYTVMRRYLADGNLPPADAVRVEEFVNYFDQGYANPNGVAFGIYADGASSPFNDNGTYLLRFGIQGYSVSESARKPASLTFVIDSSGSMADGGRLEMVKQSLQLLVDRLSSNDTVAIVAYSTDAWVVLNPTPGNDRNTILNAIYNLQPMQTTNAEAGLRLGYQLAMQAYRSNASNRVILCSDGVANTGNINPDVILSEVHGYVDEGVTLATVGVGMGNYNDVLLEQLADNGDGNYAYIDDLDEARKVLVDDMVSTIEVIAYDAKIQVDFNTDVVARYRLIGYENRAVADQDFRNDAVDAGEIGAGHSATAIYAVQFKPGAAGRIATVQLRWQDANTREVREINGNFNTWDLAQRFQDASPRYQLAVIVAQYAEILRNSPWASDTSLAALSEYAYTLPCLLPEDPDVAEFAQLVARAAQIRR
jgi:Ca-activated chloride channel family protein